MSTRPNKTIELDGFYAIGKMIRVNPENDEDIKQISNFWNEFIKNNLFEKIPCKTNEDIIAIYFDYESNHLEPYSLLIGAMVSDTSKVPDGMEPLEIPPSRYAIYDVNGKFPDAIRNTWEDIWASNLDRTFTYDFEVYDKNFNIKNEVNDASICISVK